MPVDPANPLRLVPRTNETFAAAHPKPTPAPTPPPAAQEAPKPAPVAGKMTLERIFDILSAVGAIEGLGLQRHMYQGEEKAVRNSGGGHSMKLLRQDTVRIYGATGKDDKRKFSDVEKPIGETKKMIHQFFHELGLPCPKELQ